MSLYMMYKTSFNTDINECEMDMPCPASSMCVNTNGSFECVCVNGTKMDLTGNCTGNNDNNSRCIIFLNK